MVDGPLSRVAIVRLSSLGDVALASVIPEALKGRGEALMVVKTGYGALFHEDPRVSAVVELSPGGTAKARQRIREFRPTAILDLQGSLTSRRLLAPMRGIARRTVKKYSLKRRLAVLGWRWGLRPRGAFRRYLDTLEALSGRKESASPRLHIRERALSEARSVLNPDRRWVGLSPGSRWANKRWPQERYLELARRLLADETNGVAVFAGPDEGEIAVTFERTFADQDGVHVVRCPLGALPAHLALLELLITGDSGPLHVAEAVGTPVGALFGPTTAVFGFTPFLKESWVAERDLRCRPCHIHGGSRCPLGHHRCMLDISVTDVLRRTQLARDTSGKATRNLIGRESK